MEQRSKVFEYICMLKQLRFELISNYEDLKNNYINNFSNNRYHMFSGSNRKLYVDAICAVDHILSGSFDCQQGFEQLRDAVLPIYGVYSQTSQRALWLCSLQYEMRQHIQRSIAVSLNADDHVYPAMQS
jgi:hypothetical protein